MKGFLPKSELSLVKAPVGRLAQCGLCGLYKTCKTQKMPVSGKGKKKILIVAEAPGEQEDKEGIQLVGKSGRELEHYLDRLDIDMRQDCWLTNAIICHPPNNEIPNEKVVEWCRPNLIKTIEELQPEKIILLGYYSVASLIGWLWKNDVGKTMNRWVGWKIPCQQLNAWICPTWHPAYLLRAKDPVVDLYFERHLKEAIKLQGRPWEKVPDYESMITILVESEKAVPWIKKFIEEGKPVAFDYETNMLKPDTDKAWIRSCAISNGEETIAYPWVGEAVEWTLKLLRSKIGKMAHNLKFEERWTLAKYGFGVRNWIWDGMIAAHVLDNRSDITSLKFQSFVTLGVGDYNHHIDPYLRTRNGGGNEENKIRDVGVRDLLLYNGLDALLEYHLAVKQMEAFRHGTVS